MTYFSQKKIKMFKVFIWGKEQKVKIILEKQNKI